MGHIIASAIALISLSPTAANAKDAHTESCATLSPQARAVELGARASGRSLLIQDGDSHYRIDLFHTASRAPMAAPIRLVSNGQTRTVCMHEKTVVKDADGRMFWASRASTIDAKKYAKLTRNLAKPDQAGWQASIGIGD